MAFGRKSQYTRIDSEVRHRRSLSEESRIYAGKFGEGAGARSSMIDVNPLPVMTLACICSSNNTPLISAPVVTNT